MRIIEGKCFHCRGAGCWRCEETGKALRQRQETMSDIVELKADNERLRAALEEIQKVTSSEMEMLATYVGRAAREVNKAARRALEGKP